VRCTDLRKRPSLALASLAGAIALLLPACSNTPTDAPASNTPTLQKLPPVVTANSPQTTKVTPGVRLPSPTAARNWNEFKVQAAKRIVAANPDGTFMGRPQEMLLAVPVLEVELNADGTVRRIDVMRKPSQALDTTQLAIAAVHRGAPYGDMSRLPKPWKFAETFLFNDDRRFKPRTLDAGQ
jgi:hypothetical protein